MQGTTKILIALIFILLIGGGIYNSIQKPASQKNNMIAASDTLNKPEIIEETLKSLLTLGKTQKCNFTISVKGLSVEGIIYTSGTKARANIQAPPPINMTGHLIIVSQNGYIWTDQSDKGVNFSTTETSILTQKNTQIPDINQPISFSCLPWNADNSFFTPPASITFQSIPTLAPTGNSIQQTQINKIR